MPIAARTARDSSRNLYFIPARRFLGRLDRRLGFHLSELCHRSRLGCSLCLFWRSQTDHWYLLRCQPGSHRADPPFLLAPFEARHGRQVAMGDRGSLSGCNSDLAGGGRVAVYWRGTCRHSLLRQPLSAPAAASSSAGPSATVTHIGPGSFGLNPEQAFAILSKGGFAH